MQLPSFLLEEYLTQYEFSAPYLLGCSDAETVTMSELLEFASSDDLKTWETLTLGYTEPYGDIKLREQIVDSLYPGLSADNVLCFSGAEEGIYAALSVLCEPDTTVIVLTPCYQSLKEIPVSVGTQVTSIVLKEENQWKIPVEEIANSICTSRTRGIIINFPHNPSGQVISSSELNQLLEICEKNNLWLFSDEVYRLLGRPALPWAKPVAVMYEKGLSLGVMSKAYGLPGLRVGWIACQDKSLLYRMKKLKDYLSICNSAPSEVLSLIALKNQKAILNRNNEIVDRNIRLVGNVIEKHADLFSWVLPQGGCVGFVRYNGSLAVSQFCSDLIRDKGVMVLPANVYQAETPHFRIGFGRASLPEALNRFEEFLN
jgi:aspartate/methionine/tyrosine aminotransferase